MGKHEDLTELTRYSMAELKRISDLPREERAAAMEALAAHQAAVRARYPEPNGISRTKGRFPVITRVVGGTRADGTVVPDREPATWDAEEIYEYDARGRRRPRDAARFPQDRTASAYVPSVRADVGTRVRRLATARGWTVERSASKTRLVAPGGEVFEVLQPDDGWWAVVAKVPGDPHTLVTSTGPHAVDVLLAHLVDPGRVLPAVDSPVPEPEPGQTWSVTWDGGSASGMSREHAEAVARGVGLSLADVVGPLEPSDGEGA